MVIQTINTKDLEPGVRDEIVNILGSTGQLATTAHVMNTALSWYIARDSKNIIVGFMALKISSKVGYKYEIGFAYVSPESRQQGIMKELIFKVFEDVGNQGFFVTTKNEALKKALRNNDPKSPRHPLQFKSKWPSIVNPKDEVEMWGCSEGYEMKNQSLFNSYIEYISEV